MINFYKFSSLILIGFVLIISISSRYDLLDNHFSHVDDLIPLAHILDTPENSKDFILRFENFLIKRDYNFNDNFYTIIEKIYPLIRPFIISYRISLWSTYAPSQFLFTSLLVKSDSTYESLLFYSRLPSFIFYFFSLLSLIIIFSKIYKKNFLNLFLISSSILAFSWMSIIYSVQSISYSVSIFTVLIGVILLIFYEPNNHNKYKSFFVGLIFIFMLSLNYQFMFCIPGFYLAILYRQNFNLLKFIKRNYLSNIILLIGFLILYLLFLNKLTSSGVGWNSGSNDEYLFSIKNKNIIELVSYSINFFITNYFIVFKSLIGFTFFKNIFLDIFTLIFIFLSFLGLFHLFNSKDKIKISIFIFFISLVSIWIFLIIISKITLSPTRHSLILLSGIIILVPFGIEEILQKVNNNIIFKYFISFCIPIMLIIFFTNSYFLIKEKRIDKFIPGEIKSTILKHDITSIFAYSYTHNLEIMRYVRDNFSRNKLIKGGNINYSSNNISNNMVLFISHRERINNEILNNYIKFNNLSSNTSFKKISSREIRSDTEICYGNLTKNGTNSFYEYVYEIQ